MDNWCKSYYGSFALPIAVLAAAGAALAVFGLLERITPALAVVGLLVVMAMVCIALAVLPCVAASVCDWFASCRERRRRRVQANAGEKDDRIGGQAAAV
jgi:hypothetical protein